MPKLPIGIQSFAIIRQEGYCYVDKTPLIARLVEEGRYYFLARPRRFGKSLLVDTLAEAFAGNRQRKYAERECWLIGIEFDPAARNIGRFEWERVE